MIFSRILKVYAYIIVYTWKDRDPFQGENALLIIIIFTSVGPPLKKIMYVVVVVIKCTGGFIWSDKSGSCTN